MSNIMKSATQRTNGSFSISSMVFCRFHNKPVINPNFNDIFLTKGTIGSLRTCNSRAHARIERQTNNRIRTLSMISNRTREGSYFMHQRPCFVNNKSAVRAGSALGIERRGREETGMSEQRLKNSIAIDYRDRATFRKYSQ